MAYPSIVKQRIILLLTTGVMLGFSRSPSGYFKIIKAARHDWREINKSLLWQRIREFYEDKLVEFKENKDGTITVVLTENGRKRALRYDFDNMRIKQTKSWDGWWRIVIFDIPEKKKAAREALRKKLKELGLIEMQKSVLVFPFECKDEVEFVAEFFEVDRHIRYIRAKYVTNDAELKKEFGIF